MKHKAFYWTLYQSTIYSNNSNKYFNDQSNETHNISLKHFNNLLEMILFVKLKNQKIDFSATSTTFTKSINNLVLQKM